MSRTVKLILGVILVGLVLVGLFVVDQFFYPFTASPPYYSDVERLFNRIQIPADWKETYRFDNSGIAGKRCPIEPGSACFLKSKMYELEKPSSLEQVKAVFQSSGCPVVAVIDNTSLGDTSSKYRLKCSIEGLDVGGDFDTGKGQVYVSVTSS